MKSALRFTPLFLLLFFSPAGLLAQVGSSSVSSQISARTVTWNTHISLNSRRPPVTGSPVSYDEVSQGTRLLADGTRITPKPFTISFYRDSAGRVRTERPVFTSRASGGSNLKVIEIPDPVAGFQYVLDPQNHIAYRFPSAASAPSPVPSPQVKSASVTPPSTPNDTRQSQTTTESLGTEVIEGLSVEGRRMTTVVPVGAMDNDRPITTTCDYWYSRDLATDIVRDCSDPLGGDRTTHFVNINRAEPDPSLFQVPPDYQVVDGPADGQVTLKLQLPQP